MALRVVAAAAVAVARQSIIIIAAVNFSNPQSPHARLISDASTFDIRCIDSTVN